jgi:hypothetical protein
LVKNQIIMPDVKTIRRKLKTAEGQLLLLAATFAGALVMAVGTLVARPFLFEPYIRHRVVELPDALKERGEQVASGELAADSLKNLTVAQVAGLYGGLINNSFDDGENRVAESLFKFHSEVLMDRLKTTAAVGNHGQRRRAVELLEMSKDEPSGMANRSRAAELCRHIFDRARRTGDTELRQASEAVLRQLKDLKGEPDE